MMEIITYLYQFVPYTNATFLVIADTRIDKEKIVGLFWGGQK